MQRNNRDSSAILQHALAVFRDLNYTLLNGAQEKSGICTLTEREGLQDVVLRPRLRAALRNLNPGLAGSIIERAIDLLVVGEGRGRGSGELLKANQEIYKLLRDGIKIDVLPGENAVGEVYQDRQKLVKVIEWDKPERNDFLLVQNLWVSGNLNKHCLDLVVFINGLPLILLAIEDSELHHIHARIEREMQSELPTLSWYNAFLVVANAFTCRMGSFSTPWEHFFQWKRISDENERASTTLDTLLRGTCEQTRLLDILENFILFDDAGGLKKLIARNHQYLGVNNIIAALRERERQPADEQHDKLGVFWHTQGSGKSYSMIFFVRKVQRKIANDYKFVVVTDRDDLDTQIYKNFKHTGTIEEDPKEVQATDGKHLKRLLSEPHLILFTLIQKFHCEKPGQNYEELDGNHKIIVITDEAHRTEEGILAKNMRDALPHAAFLGFTGTPLMDDNRTRTTFGDYVSIYNFRRAIDDGVTVDLYFENHTPEIQLPQKHVLDAEVKRLLEDTQLDPRQREQAIQQILQDQSYLSNDERLDWIAEDLVAHFLQRGYQGKALVVSSGKIIAVRTYNRVQKAWGRYKARLRTQLAAESDLIQRQIIQDKLVYMDLTNMAVVVSFEDGDNEHFAEFSAKNNEVVEIESHHRRFKHENLAERFKEPTDALRIAFVCDMWSTGFDVPCLSTVYLNNHLEKHTLMQTIARANRVFDEKVIGLIVDYIGCVHELEKALEIYAPKDTDSPAGPDRLVGNKSELVEFLREKIQGIELFCVQQGIDIPALLLQLRAANSRAYQETLLEEAIDSLLRTDEIKLDYLLLASEVIRLYKAILPDAAEAEFTLPVHLHTLIRQGMHKAMRRPLPDGIVNDIARLVRDAIVLLPQEERISLETHEAPGNFLISQIDLSKLSDDLHSGPRHTRAEQLRQELQAQIQQMISTNKSRVTYLESLEKAVERYNEGSANQAVYLPFAAGDENILSLPRYQEEQAARERLLDEYDDALLGVAQRLTSEEQRHQREGLSEKELAIFDILIANVTLSNAEYEQVKQHARDLLAEMRRYFVIDWTTKSQPLNQVAVAIEDELEQLTAIYTEEMRQHKKADILLHVRELYKNDSSSTA
jgi:type I restriction enzyme, R subunit